MIETECLSDLCLDELLVGESVPAAAHQHLASCGQCRARRDELAADRASFRAAPPPLPLRRPARARSLSPWIAGAGGAAAVAAAAAVLLFVSAAPGRGGGPGSEPADDPGETRTKGSAWLGLVIEHGGAQRTGEPGEKVHPGDTLAFSINTPRPAYVAVLGRDAHGRLTTYFPSEQQASSMPIGPGADQLLPLATVLDDTLGPEQLIAAFCERPVPVAELRGSLESPPAGCTLDTFAIEKVP